MTRSVLVFLLFGMLVSPSLARHHSSGAHPTGTRTHSSSRKSSHSSKSHHSKIHRSSAAKHEFERESGYAHGRKGYVVDHKTPLACGGLDAPSNMQWQTVAEAKAKDRTERQGCK